MTNFSVWSQSRLEPPFFAWSRSRSNLVGAGANPIWSELESAPRPWTFGAGASQKKGWFRNTEGSITWRIHSPGLCSLYYLVCRCTRSSRASYQGWSSPPTCSSSAGSRQAHRELQQTLALLNISLRVSKNRIGINPIGTRFQLYSTLKCFIFSRLIIEVSWILCYVLHSCLI